MICSWSRLHVVPYKAYRRNHLCSFSRLQSCPNDFWNETKYLAALNGSRMSGDMDLSSAVTAQMSLSVTAIVGERRRNLE